VLRERGSGTRLATDRFFAAQGFEAPTRLELGSNEAIKEAVAGRGLAVLSRHALRDSELETDLCVLPVQGMPIPSQWHVVHPRAKQLSPIAQVFAPICWAPQARHPPRPGEAQCRYSRRHDRHHPRRSHAGPGRALQQFADARDWGLPFAQEPGLGADRRGWRAAGAFPVAHRGRAANSRPTRQAVAHEMADVLLYLVQLSTVLDIDLIDAARAKMALNAQKYPRRAVTRPQPQIRHAVRAAQRLMYTGRFMPYLPFTTASAVAPMGGMMPRACARAMGSTNDYHHYHRGHLSTRRWPSRRPPGVFSLLPRTNETQPWQPGLLLFVRRSPCTAILIPVSNPLGGHPVACARCAWA
jgi:hypothetical protein